MVEKRIGSGVTVGMMVRVSEELRDRIKAAADANGRSQNSEIVATLEDRYPELSPWRSAMLAIRAMNDVLERLPDGDEKAKQIHQTQELIRAYSDVILSDPDVVKSAGPSGIELYHYLAKYGKNPAKSGSN